MQAQQRTHHTQALPEQLSRAFSDARDATDLFNEAASPPSFHEIRLLGGKLHQRAAWSVAHIQALMAYASSDMTDGCLAGHETSWVEVSAGD